MARRLLRHVRCHGIAYVALFVALSGTAVAAGTAIKGDITQIIAGAGVSVSPTGDQAGPVTVGVTTAPDADLLDGVNSTAFGRTTASGTVAVAFDDASPAVTLPLTGVRIAAFCFSGGRLPFAATLQVLAAGGTTIYSVYPFSQAITNGETNLGLDIASFSDDPSNPQQFSGGVGTYVLDTAGKTITIHAGAAIWETAGGGQPQGCTFNWQATESPTP